MSAQRGSGRGGEAVGDVIDVERTVSARHRGAAHARYSLSFLVNLGRASKISPIALNTTKTAPPRYLPVEKL